MDSSILAITYIVLFIPGIILFYNLLQIFNYEKILKSGKAGYFKVFYILICIILSALLAASICYTVKMIGEIVMPK
ncbi:MAG: DUF1146 domain-containing protein [Bacilli bacterium]|jgi:uncharacterized membrane protein YwzB|nr:DUF1146 domain-containing protein [Bacilli bacterium]